MIIATTMGENMPGRGEREAWNFDKLYREAQTSEGRARQQQRLRELEQKRRAVAPTNTDVHDVARTPVTPTFAHVVDHMREFQLLAERERRRVVLELQRQQWYAEVERARQERREFFVTSDEAEVQTSPTASCTLEKGCAGFCEACRLCTQHCTCPTPPGVEPPQGRRIRL
jgi:hypothetical protein